MSILFVFFVISFQYQAKTLIGKNVSNMTYAYFASTETLNLNSIKQISYPTHMSDQYSANEFE